jgi:hypothetical protein
MDGSLVPKQTEIEIMYEYYTSITDWTCPVCKAHIKMLHSNRDENRGGMYCQCAAWGGPLNEKPETILEWEAYARSIPCNVFLPDQHDRYWEEERAKKRAKKKLQKT